MAQLLDLANETLLKISSYLEPELGTHVGPFHQWSQVLQDQVNKARFKTQTISALSLACKRLHGLFTPVLYSCISLTDTSTYDKPQLPLLLRSFDTNDSLVDYVTYATAPGLDSFEFQTLFWLPNIHTLSIQGFKSRNALEWEDHDHLGTSPVHTLRLTQCGAHEEALKELLSWPSALEELWYEADQGEWSWHYEGEEAVEFTASAIERCLASQADSLKKLIFSRRIQPHEGLGYSDCIDLRRYEKLQSLSINYVFLVGLGQNMDACERLPKSLVELDVFYDDSGYINFLQGDAVRPEWLFDLLGKKQNCFTALERVRILSIECYGDDDAEEEEEENVGTETGGGEWNPGTELTQAIIDANVSFSVFLHEDRRFKYVADGKGWEDNWEETLKIESETA